MLLKTTDTWGWSLKQHNLGKLTSMEVVHAKVQKYQWIQSIWEMVKSLALTQYLKPHVARYKPERPVRMRFLKGLTCPARKVNFIL